MNCSINLPSEAKDEKINSVILHTYDSLLRLA